MRTFPTRFTLGIKVRMPSGLFFACVVLLEVTCVTVLRAQIEGLVEGRALRRQRVSDAVRLADVGVHFCERSQRVSHSVSRCAKWFVSLALFYLKWFVLQYYALKSKGSWKGVHREARRQRVSDAVRLADVGLHFCER